MLKNQFSAADTNHRAPYTKISFATQQSESTSADAAALTLSNIVLCTIGEAEGWGICIDALFIADMVKDINKNMKQGVKSNLRHNYENAGFQLGRIKNVRIDGDRVLGDLKCYASADKSPLAPGMATWLIELVAEDPEAMMMSIVVKIAYHYQKDEKGNHHKVWEYNTEGRWISPNYDMPIYIAYGSIESCDAVAEGALTEAMFSKTQSTETDFFTKLGNTLKTAFGIAKTDAATLPSVSDSNNMENQKPPMAPTAIEFADVQTQLTQLTAEKSALYTQLTAANAALAELTATAGNVTIERDALKSSVVERDATIAALTAEVALFKELPGAEHAGGNTDTTTGKVGFGKHHQALKTELGLK